MTAKYNKVFYTTLLYLQNFVVFTMAITLVSEQKTMNQLCQSYGSDGNALTYPDKPNNYIVCFDGKGYKKACSDDTECFSHSSQNCGDCPDPDCSDKRRGEKIGDNEDCQIYHVCMGIDETQTIHCPPHQFYSKTNGNCTSPLEAKCAQNWCAYDGLQFAATKCFEYYECVGGFPELKQCPYNENFDKAKGKCVEGLCDQRQPTCADGNEGEKLPHPLCYKFYACINKTPFVGQCGTGYYFDVKSKDCIKDVNQVCV